MKELKVPRREEFESLREAVTFNHDEQAYWDEMMQRRDSRIDEKDYIGKARFYLRELQLLEGRFGERVAVKRRLEYVIGHAYECEGTFALDGHDPRERIPMFENAVMWYQAADETVGFLTDYSLRQSEACAGAATYRREAGIEDEVTESFRMRAGQLLETCLGGGKIVVINSQQLPSYFDELKHFADKKIEDVVDAYLFKNKSEQARRN